MSREALLEEDRVALGSALVYVLWKVARGPLHGAVERVQLVKPLHRAGIRGPSLGGHVFCGWIY